MSSYDGHTVGAQRPEMNVCRFNDLGLLRALDTYGRERARRKGMTDDAREDQDGSAAVIVVREI